MKKLLITCLLVLGIVGFIGFPVSSARADIIDPLHGFCNGSPCIDNGTNTPLGNSTTFGFSISPGPQTGVFFLDILVPNNYSIPGSFSITGTQGGAANNQAISGTATPISGPAWTSGQLDTYLGISAAPANPIGAFLPTTQTLDPGATGFFVFQVNLGTMKIWDNANETNGPIFNLISGLSADSGAYIVAFGGTGFTSPVVATANSGALLVGGTESVGVPEPSVLLLLGAGLIGIGGLARRIKIKKS